MKFENGQQNNHLPLPLSLPPSIRIYRFIITHRDQALNYFFAIWNFLICSIHNKECDQKMTKVNLAVELIYIYIYICMYVYVYRINL